MTCAPQVTVPLLLVNSSDDPLVHPSLLAIPRALAGECPNCVLANETLQVRSSDSESPTLQSHHNTEETRCLLHVHRSVTSRQTLSTVTERFEQVMPSCWRHLGW